MTIVTRSRCKLKDDDKDLKRTHISGKGSTASGSTNLDASGLRRSARETLVKKQRASCPVNLPTSVPVEKCTPPTPPAKRKSERLEKQRMLNPLTTSERGENQCPSSSSSSRKSEKSPNLLDNKSKRKRDNGNRLEVKKDCIVLGKRRLDANSYRKSFLKPQPKKTQESEPNKKLKEHEETSQGDAIHVGACSFKEVEEVAEGIVRNGVEVEEIHAREVADIAAERPLEKSSSTGEIELSHSSRKRIKVSEEYHGSNIRDSSPVSRCHDDILQSSPGVSATEELPNTGKEFSYNSAELCENLEEYNETEVADITAERPSEKSSSTGEIELSPSSRKHIKLSEEFHGSHIRDSSPVSRFCDDILQSSPGVSATEELLSTEKEFSCNSAELCENLEEYNETFREDTDHMRANSFEEVEDVTEGIVKNIKKVQEKDIGEAADIAHEGPCDGLKNPDVGKSNIIEDVELSHSSSEHIKHLDGFHKSDNGDSSLASKCSDNSSQTSPAVSGKEAIVDAEIASSFYMVETSQGVDGHLEASSFKEVENIAEGIVSNREEVGGKDTEEGADQTVDSINYGLRNLEAGTSKDIGELSHSNGLNVISYEFDGSTNRVSSPMSKCNEGALQLSLGPSANEALRDAEKVNLDCSARDKLQNVSTRSTLWGRSISGDCCVEKVHTLNTSKRKMISEEVDSDAPKTVASEELGSSADPITSPPSESMKANFLERCDMCSKRQRFEDKSQNTKMCSCKYGDNNDFPEESIAEYPNLPPFIATGGDMNGDASLKADCGDTISKVNEGIAHTSACERMPGTPNFVEYLVPVRLSNVQLEQYCATLLSNSFSLCSCSKNDPVGALRDILISVRKCCDHPYLVDQSLPILLTKDLPEVKYLEVGINASGKLQTLEKILSEIKTRGLRALILFQSIGGSGRNCIGDILDDFLRQRFGPDSYERVDSGLVKSKKQAALSMFNDKERMRFVFLLENRACLPSIKLSSVDMVILFDSDWNPLNDFRALQKITIESQLEQIKVFRLYSSCTVEEKVLSLAKQDTILDSNIQNISCSISHSLLLWGAYFLFHKLDEFHNGCPPSIVSNISSEQFFLNDVVQELLSQLPGDGNIETKNCRYVLKAQQSGASYSKDIILIGEKEIQLTDEELPHVLWANVLNGRHPQWKYASEPSQRNRRKVQILDDLQKKTQETAEAVKKRKKVVSNTIDQNTLKSCLDDKRKAVSLGEEGASCTPAANGSHNLSTSIASANCVNHPVLDQPETHTVESEERMNLRDSQKNLLLSLKPAISRLAEILQLPDDVKNIAGKFLEYMMNNHQVSRDPVTIFEAFQISLCWSAASLFKYKIDHNESLSLIKQHLKFQCSHEETEYVYEKMRDLKKKFARQAKSVNLISAENSSLKDREERNLHMKTSQASYFAEQELEDGEIREIPKTPTSSIQLDSSKQKMVADPENGCGLSKIEFLKTCQEVEETHRQRMKKLHQKQMEEFQNFNKKREKEKEVLESKHKVESAIIRSVHSNFSVKLEKLKMLDQYFARKKEELNNYMKEQQKKLADMQRTASKEEKRMKDHWLEEAKAGRSVLRYAMLPLSDYRLREESIEKLDQVVVSQENLGSGFRVEQGKVGQEKGTMASTILLGKQDTSRVVSVLPGEPVELCDTVPDKVVEVVAMGPVHPTMQIREMGLEVNTLVSESAADAGFKQQRKVCSSGSAPPSLEQTLIDPQLDQDYTARSQDSQSPSPQVPVNEHAQPSLQAAELQNVDVSACNMQYSELEIQTSGPGDYISSNRVNNGTPSLPLAVQSQQSPSVTTVSTEQSQPNAPACIHQTSGPGNVVSSNQVNNDSLPLPLAVQLQQSASATTVSTEPNQPNAAAIQSNQERCNELLQLFEAQIRAPLENQHVNIYHSGQLPRNPFSRHVASQHSQLVVPASSIDQEQRNERQASFQQFEPVEDQDELFNHHDSLPENQFRNTASQLNQVPAEPPAIEQRELLNYSVSHPNAQSPLHMPIGIGGSGSNLSNPRTMNIVPELSSPPPHNAPVSFQISRQVCLDPLQNELGRIRKQEEQTIKMYENEKMRLNYECEKELEEVRRKYDTMIQNTEGEFTQRKKELETNYNIVKVNRRLAVTFRLQHDAMMLEASRLQQGVPLGSMQQVCRLSSTQATQRPSPSPGPPSAPPVAPPVQMLLQPSAFFSRSSIASHLSQVLSSPVNLQIPATSSTHPHLIPQLSSHMAEPFSSARQTENMSCSRGRPTPNPLQDIGQTIDPWDTLKPSMAGCLRGPAARQGIVPDSVCLSDDD
ncbi:hypothetical protein AQUCO_01300175v1 [Aquilegia coerulea]|uniref:Helicase C-terminal domain-containing protein n=1 Tax=Aquilegia coerulea TaxID=218851 RepID=A0A2G5E049_AQUCA|nr:hypothetical protein AQUCO_01300175v1 [Aquilegia coerulea]